MIFMVFRRTQLSFPHSFKDGPNVSNLRIGPVYIEMILGISNDSHWWIQGGLYLPPSTPIYFPTPYPPPPNHTIFPMALVCWTATLPHENPGYAPDSDKHIS